MLQTSLQFCKLLDRKLWPIKEIWMSQFRDKLDQKTYDFIFQTLVTNQFTSRLQIKLLTSEQLDYMFSKDLALGAKALLVYHVDLLTDE